MCPISWCITCRLKRLFKDKHSSLLHPFVSLGKKMKSCEYSLCNLCACWGGWGSVNSLLVFNVFNYNIFFWHPPVTKPGNPNWKGRISTVDLLLLTSSNLLLFILKLHFSFLQNNLSQWGGQLQWAFPFIKDSLVKI